MSLYQDCEWPPIVWLLRTNRWTRLHIFSQGFFLFAKRTGQNSRLLQMWKLVPQVSGIRAWADLSTILANTPFPWKGLGHPILISFDINLAISLWLGVSQGLQTWADHILRKQQIVILFLWGACRWLWSCNRICRLQCPNGPQEHAQQAFDYHKGLWMSRPCQTQVIIW